MTITSPDAALSELMQYLATGADPRGFVAADMEADLNFPHTSFRLTGKPDFDRLRAGVSAHPWRLEVERVEPTASGFVAVVTIRTDQPDGERTERTVSLVTLKEGRMTRFAHWCTGAI